MKRKNFPNINQIGPWLSMKNQLNILKGSSRNDVISIKGSMGQGYAVNLSAKNLDYVDERVKKLFFNNVIYVRPPIWYM